MPKTKPSTDSTRRVTKRDNPRDPTESREVEPKRRSPGRPRSMPIEEQRERILSAARRVFAAHDFHGATIDRVAREAGVTRPLVYELFGGKEELFIAVADDAVVRLIEGIRERLVHHTVNNARDLIRADVASLFSFIEAEPDVASIIRIVEYGGVGPAKSEVMVGRRRIEDQLAEVWVEAMEAFGGITVEAARLMALATLAMVEAVGFRQPSERAWDVEPTIDFLTDFIYGGMFRLYDKNHLRDFGG